MKRRFVRAVSPIGSRLASLAADMSTSPLTNSVLLRTAVRLQVRYRLLDRSSDLLLNQVQVTTLFGGSQIIHNSAYLPPRRQKP